MFNKPIHENHVYTIVLGKGFDLATNGSFYCDCPYQHMLTCGCASLVLMWAVSESFELNCSG